MVVLNNAVRHATDGFIGILDMFGFEETQTSQIEHLLVSFNSKSLVSYCL